MKNYIYYLFGSSNVNDDVINESIFKNGLANYKGNDINSSAIYIDATEEELLNIIKDFNYDTSFIIKINKMYLFPKVINGTLKQIPLPIWRRKNGISYLSNELIYFAYKKSGDKVFYNPMYSELHDPTGLQFDKKQKEIFDDNKILRWQKFYKLRDSLDYEKLKKIDIDYNLWQSAIDQYSNVLNQKR